MALTIRKMVEGDAEAARSLMRQLGYDLEPGEFTRRYIAVASVDSHALLVGDLEERVVALLHVYARPAIDKPPEEELVGRPANYRSVACMKERGVDLSAHISRWIGDLDLDQYRWIVCAGDDEADKVRSALGADAASVMVANEH